MTMRKLTGMVITLCVCALIAGCGDETNGETAQIQENKPQPVIQIREDTKESTTGKEEDAAEPADGESEARDAADPEEAFYITEITDELFARMEGKSFKEDCTMPRDDLRYLHVLHKTLEGETKEGELVVNVHIAETVLDIFKQLYEADYPIEKIRLVDEYDADDERSMEDNNTSCFNFRMVPRTKRISKHGRGLAIDLNPLYNPYVVNVNTDPEVSPANGEAYADRSLDFPYKIDENDTAYILFTQNGFAWGGAWKNEKDYQHFEIPSEKIREWYPE